MGHFTEPATLQIRALLRKSKLCGVDEAPGRTRRRVPGNLQPRDPLTKGEAAASLKVRKLPDVLDLSE